jgi:MFS family permease
MGSSVGFAAPVASGIAGVVVAPLAGWLSDRVGRKPVMLGSWAIVLVGGIPMFALLEHSRSLLPLVILSAGLSACMVSAIAALLSCLGEGLPMRIRSGALGLAYASAVAAFGGTTQFMVAWLTKATHSPMAPAWYMTAAVGVSFLAMLAMPETAPSQAGRRAQRNISVSRMTA